MSATGIPIPIWTLANSSGAPRTGARVYSWVPSTAGQITSTARTLYTSPDASTTPAANPYVLGSSGHGTLYKKPSEGVFIQITGAEGAADAATVYHEGHYPADLVSGLVGDIDIRSFGLTGDGIRGTTGVATATDNTFTDASAAFVAADVGKIIVVIGAGVAAAALVTTIASRNSATSIELTTAPSTTVASNCEYKYGTNNTSAMAALKTYVAAQTNVPHVVWPAGFYLYTASPNWFVNDLMIDFVGEVTLCCLSTAGTNGFEIDSGSTLASGYCWGVRVRGSPKVEMLATGGHAVFLRGLLRSSIAINARSAGASSAAFRTDFCVGNDFNGCAVSNNDQQPGGFANGATPAYGIFSTRRGSGENSAHNKWGNIIVEGVTTGVHLDYSTGEVFEAGTIEGCGTGISLTANCVVPRFIDIDVEANTVDILDVGAVAPVFDFYNADIAIRRTNTRYPRGHLSGIGISNNVADATNDIDFAIGACRDGADETDIVVHTGLIKRLDAVWAAGTNQGGRDTADAIANQTYHCHAIFKRADGSYDFLFSASATSPTLPTGYTHSRRVGSIVRSGGAILAFTQNVDEFLWTVPRGDLSVGGPTDDTGELRVLSVPTGVVTDALLAFSVTDATPAAATYVLVTPPAVTDTQPSALIHTVMLAATGAGNPVSVSAQLRLRTDTSARIRTRVRASTADTLINVTTHGWVDTRGR